MQCGTDEQSGVNGAATGAYNISFDTVNLNDSDQTGILECATDQQSEVNAIATGVNNISFDTVDLGDNDQDLFSFRKSTTAAAYQNIKSFLASFNDKISCMKMTQNDKDKIYNLCTILTRNSFLFAKELINDENGMNTSFALNQSCEYICNHFLQTNTSYKRKKICQNNAKYVPPVSVALGTRFNMVNVPGTPTKYPRRIQNNMQYIPITNTIKSLFSQHDFRKAYFMYNFGDECESHTCKPGVYQNVCCGEVYQKNELFNEHPESLQIQIGSDDCTVTNALQSKAGIYKLTLVYFTIRNLPQKYLSKLDNIFLVCICFTDDLKSQETDFNDIWRVLVRDIHYLETFGIQVTDDINIKGTVISTAFDNLGAHVALGFAESCNSNYYCVCCEMPKNICQRSTKPVTSYRRTISSYTEQLDIIANCSKVDFTLTKGIKRYCVLNDLQYFHMLDNQGLDIMHDIAEGAIFFTLKRLFEYCFTHNIIKEKDLQQKIQFYDYGQLSRSNTPSILNMAKDSLNQNAAQSKCLFENIPFIFWEYKDNQKLKKAWICVQSLLKICQIVYSNKIVEADLKELENQVHIHLSNFQQIFKQTLKPKQHNMLHYAELIRRMGPLVNLNMIRYEAKHQEIKDYVGQTKNFKDLPKYLATRHQQKLIAKQNTFEEEIFHGVPFPIKEMTSQKKNAIINYFQGNNDVHEVKWVQYHSSRFNKELTILHDSDIYEISNIFYENKKIFFHCIRYDIVQLNVFLNSLELQISEPVEYKIISFDELSVKKSFQSRTIENVKYLKANTLELNNLFNGF